MASFSPPGKEPVLGVGISKTAYAEVVRYCRMWVDDLRSRKGLPEALSRMPGRYICVTSVHGIVSALKNSRLKSILNRADIATPDGMPVVWAMRSFGVHGQTRVYGPDLMLAICSQAAACQHRIFLYGAREETLTALKAMLRRRFPDLVIAGAWAPPFRPLTPEEDDAAVRLILDSSAEIVFVGLSTPKQEMWMSEHQGRLPGIVLIGVGAAFDFHAGMVRQAPAWMQRSGLEWLFRLCMEPDRLWKRYLLETPVFLPLWALQKLGIRKY